MNGEYRNSKTDFYQAMGLFNASQELFMGIMPVVAIAIGGYLIMRDRMNYIDLITFTLYITTFISPIRKLTQFVEVFASGYAGLQRFSELMAEKPTVQEKDDAGELRVTEGRIDIDHVSFSYANGQRVLHDIDLHVDGGTMTAVVGTTGGGKTTLCQLIPRFYDVTSGAIRIDGTDIRDVTKESLRKAVGIVQQDDLFFRIPSGKISGMGGRTPPMRK